MWKFANDVIPSGIDRPNNIDQSVEDYTERIINSAHDHIGQTSGKPHKGKTFPLWDNECKRVVAEKRRARRILEQHPTIENLEIYRSKVSNSMQL